MAGLKDSYKPLIRVPTLGEAPRDNSREILGRSPAQEALYSSVARASRSSGETARGGPTAESTRGDVGGVIVVSKDEGSLLGGDKADVGDAGGLHCDVAFWNGGG